MRAHSERWEGKEVRLVRPCVVYIYHTAANYLRELMNPATKSWG